MATERVPVHTKAASDQDTAQLVKEHSHAFQNTLNTTQTDSPAIAETENPDIDNDLKTGSGLEAPKPTDTKPAPDTKPPVTEPAGSPIGAIPIARESQVSVGPMNETVAGEKRDIDSTVTPTPAPAEVEAQQKPELSDEPDTKKLKTDEKAATESNGTAAAPSSTENAVPKKASRSKKDKIKDAVNKVIPGDGIGSRTRSRTKGA
ncbi:hypothetical protein N7517_002478 [Penicillium concentricum]|uniref:Uncharacterized protein n=1 Tax=Penicillium concentricum TaxID=293559 RepID=A0A9W9VJU7_9EURO|nr:uncharacterized protein N7517_002478 [Penicillium concentricum]KAJ5384567.1 hypothetical protein N7517_002478 [Penicillium concentricum]